MLVPVMNKTGLQPVEQPPFEFKDNRRKNPDSLKNLK